MSRKLLTVTFIIILFSLFTLSGCVQKNKSLSTTESKKEEIMEKVDEANKMLEKTVPDNLTQCTAEDLKNAGNCTVLPEKKVCGYDHTIYKGGKEANHGITYNNACFYCQLFGDDGVMELGTTTVTGLGYTEGECQ